MNFDIEPYLKNLYKPSLDSHKGQNGKLLIIGGSHLFHAASLWALKIASRMVDMVFYSSVPENNEIVQRAKDEFRDGIVVRRDDLDHYMKEADCILIGPGMNRTEKSKIKYQKSKIQIKNKKEQEKSLTIEQLNNGTMSLSEINQLQDEGELTHEITRFILEHYPNKKFVLDAGALQELDLKWLENLTEIPILTPHKEEFRIKNLELRIGNLELKEIILLKGQTDKIYSQNHNVIEISGGVPGMTKGGTGDVLAGMAAAFYCKSDALTSAVAASFFNKKAGEDLFKTMGNNFNASDLVDQLPKTMKNIVK